MDWDVGHRRAEELLVWAHSSNFEVDLDWEFAGKEER